MEAVPGQIARWLRGRLFSLGTDGFGRSDPREALRRFFEVDAECVVIATLYNLARRGAVDRKLVQQAIVDLGVDPEKANPLYARAGGSPAASGTSTETARGESTVRTKPILQAPALV